MKIYLGCEKHCNDEISYDIPILASLTKEGLIKKLFEYEKNEWLKSANYLRWYGGRELLIANEKETKATNMTLDEFRNEYLDNYKIIEMDAQ